MPPLAFRPSGNTPSRRLGVRYYDVSIETVMEVGLLGERAGGHEEQDNHKKG